MYKTAAIGRSIHFYWPPEAQRFESFHPWNNVKFEARGTDGPPALAAVESAGQNTHKSATNGRL
jgi:hypothetical protein